MELVEFLAQTRAEVRQAVADRLAVPGNAYPYEEMIFTEVVMEHMSEIGMTFDPEACHYAATVGKARLRLSGYAVSEDADQLDLFVSLYAGAETITAIADSETKTAAEQCVRFLARCAEGRLVATMDQSNDAHRIALTIQDCYATLDQIRIYVLTDGQAKAKSFQTREVQGKSVKLEVMDIERLWRHWSAGKPRDELIVNFKEVSGGALPCVFVPGEGTDYSYALTVIPGEALRFVYEKYGSRLLEANVRSFLSQTGKVNRGIRDTLRDRPERFMAYNNGIVLVADELHLERADDGSPGIVWLKGMQIVNGGQTTASIYFASRRPPGVDLRRVRVPAKIIVLRATDPAQEEGLIADISKFANSQNAVKLSDLSANKPFHVKVEQLSLSTFCVDGVSRWFYERAAGSYNTLLAREGDTPARLDRLKKSIPSARRITKTDLAKFLNAWSRKPHLVSLGSQKNFERFMEDGAEGGGGEALPDVGDWKRMVAKAIVFKTVQKLIRPMFPAFQANVAAYTVAVLSGRLGDRLDLDRIWQQQELSDRLQEQVQAWASGVHDALQQTASGRMISEWAKKPECWEAVQAAHMSEPLQGIAEVR